MKEFNKFTLLYVRFKHFLKFKTKISLFQTTIALFIVTLAPICFGMPKVIPPKGSAFISADYVEYNEDEDFIYAKGNIKVIIDQYTIIADLILYDIQKDRLLAEGRVKVYEGDNKILLGEKILFKDKLKAGIISNFALKFKSNNALLTSRLALKVSENQAYLNYSTFTPCTVTCDHKPIWQISAKDTHIDFDEEKMVYKNVFFEVYGVPILFTPYFSHPTPDARAQSGILTPSIKNNNLSIPIYLRAKPNMDFTLTPRVSKKYTIFELEGRHKVSIGDYSFNSSYGQVPYKNKKVDSAYISTRGNFYGDNLNYGFNLNRTSDKAYLKNYHDKYDSYLTSKLYLNNVQNYDYFLLEGMHFQSLRQKDLNNRDPLILPKIRTKNVLNLNDEETTYLTVQSDILNYYEPSGRRIGRGSANISLTNNSLTSSGHILSFIIRDREDLYFIKNLDENSQARKTKTRNIPEFQSIWRYPLVNTSNISNITIEPVASLTMGKKFQPRYNKYSIIDPSRYEIAEDNILNSNRYSGIDYHEFGNRLSYGVNSGVSSGNNYYDLFLGQFLNKHNTYTNDNIGNIGRVSANLFEKIEMFYRFRRDKHYRPIRDELGMDIWYDKVQMTTTFIRLENIKKYYSPLNSTNVSNKATQSYYKLEYQFNPNWLIGHELRLDMSNKKIRPLYRSIRVTYFKDCVSISVKFYDDYTFDSVRGIKKIHNKSMSVGLKVLNM